MRSRGYTRLEVSMGQENEKPVLPSFARARGWARRFYLAYRLFIWKRQNVFINFQATPSVSELSKPRALGVFLESA